MQLLIRQRVFSWSDTYDVYDEYGEPRYYIRGEIFSLGHRIHIYDKQSGQEVGAIRQRLLTWMPCFDIEIYGRVAGRVQKQISLFGQKYHVDYYGWRCEGDIFGWDYRTYQGDMEVLSISKKWLTWGDTYVMEFHNPAHELPGLLLVLAIDAANCSKD